MATVVCGFRNQGDIACGDMGKLKERVARRVEVFAVAFACRVESQRSCRRRRKMSAVGLCSPVERGAMLDEWEDESGEPGGAWAGCVRWVSAQAGGSCAWVQGVRKEVDEPR